MNSPFLAGFDPFWISCNNLKTPQWRLHPSFTHQHLALDIVGRACVSGEGGLGKIVTALNGF